MNSEVGGSIPLATIGFTVIPETDLNNIKLDLLGTRQVALRRLCKRSVVTKQEVGAQLNEFAMIRGGNLIQCSKGEMVVNRKR